MKYTPEEIRYEIKWELNQNTADMLEAMLKVVDAVSALQAESKNRSFNAENASYCWNALDLALAPFDFTTEKEVKP